MSATAEKKQRYTVRFEGLSDARCEKSLRAVSSLASQPARKKFFKRYIKKHAEDDLPKLLKTLHASGFYDALISLEMKEETSPLQVTYQVTPGKRYTIASEKITLVKAPKTMIWLPKLESLRPTPGQNAEADALQDKAKHVQELISEHNCVVSANVVAALTLHPEEATADVVYETEIGPEANFGDLTITGNKTVSDRYIKRLVPWEEGECFHASAPGNAHATLLKSQLFSVVDIKYAKEPDSSKKVPVTLAVTERFHRTMKAGLSYGTEEGAGANFGWEHRNLFGEGEKLEVQSVVSTLEYSVEGNYNEPYFRRKDQSLKLNARTARERPEAYTSTNISATGILERTLTPQIRAGLGAGYRISQVVDNDGKEDYGLVSVPGYGVWDNRDNLLNPKKGVLARIEATPHMNTLTNGTGFMQVKASGSTYFSFPSVYEPVFAMRGTVGSITGASTRAVPADLRFYAGGGASVRGYAYQALSPMNDRDEPFGGKSLIELSGELRVKVTDTWGIAMFLDGGNAFESGYPDFSENLRFGAGVGVRYYTGFGPLRMDVAVPLNQGPHDSAFQLYVSLGQAF